MSIKDKEQYIGPAHRGGKSFGAETLLALLDSEGNEEQLVVVESTKVGGLAGEIDSIKYLNTRVVENRGLEPILTNNCEKVPPGRIVKKLGRFSLSE